MMKSGGKMYGFSMLQKLMASPGKMDGFSKTDGLPWQNGWFQKWSTDTGKVIGKLMVSKVVQKMMKSGRKMYGFSMLQKLMASPGKMDGFSKTDGLPCQNGWFQKWPTDTGKVIGKIDGFKSGPENDEQWWGHVWF